MNLFFSSHTVGRDGRSAEGCVLSLVTSGVGVGGCLFAWHEPPNLTRCRGERVFLLQGCNVVELAFVYIASFL